VLTVIAMATVIIGRVMMVVLGRAMMVVIGRVTTIIIGGAATRMLVINKAAFISVIAVIRTTTTSVIIPAVI
jgi:hypothetical protein